MRIMSWRCCKWPCNANPITICGWQHFLFDQCFMWRVSSCTGKSGIINIREHIYYSSMLIFFFSFFWLKCHTTPQPILYLSVSSTSLYSLALTLAADSVDGWLPNKYIQNGNYVEHSFRTFSLCTAKIICGVLSMLSKNKKRRKEKM